MFKKSRRYGHYVHGQYVHSPGTFKLSKPDLANPLAECEFSLLKSNCAQSTEILEASLQGLAETEHDQRQRNFFGNEDRIAFLKRFALKLSEQSENLAAVVCGEVGMPLDLARAHAQETVDFVNALVNRADGAFEVESSETQLLITPFSSPVLLAVQKLAHAWLAGAPVLWKPSKRAALSALCIADFAHSESLPPGFLVVLHMEHEVLDSVLSTNRLPSAFFAGSQNVAAEIRTRAKMPLTVETGTATQAIWSAESDIDSAIESAFDFAGQSPTSLQNLFVPATLFEDLRAKLSQKIGLLAFGRTTEGCRVGPVIDDRSAHRLKIVKRRLLESGARILGESVNREALYEPNFAIAPVVFENLPPTDRFLTEEIFGPFLAIHRIEK